MPMKLIILDRDGVINVDSDQFIKSPEEWKPIPGTTRQAALVIDADGQPEQAGKPATGNTVLA